MEPWAGLILIANFLGGGYVLGRYKLDHAWQVLAVLVVVAFIALLVLAALGGAMGPMRPTPGPLGEALAESFISAVADGFERLFGTGFILGALIFLGSGFVVGISQRQKPGQ